MHLDQLSIDLGAFINLETKLINAPRSIDNCFNIEYILNPFNVNAVVDKIDSKIGSISENNNENDELKIYKDIKKILIDYFRIKEEIKYGNNNDNDVENYMYYSARKPSGNCRNTIGSGKKQMKNLFSHVKNNKSLLQETSGNNNYILMGVDKDSMGSFQFYTPTGFLVFLNKFEETIKKENIDLHKIIYEEAINKQISQMIKNLFSEIDNNYNFIKKQEDENETVENNINNNSGNLISGKDLRKALGVSIVPETTNEVENEDNKDDNKSEGSVKIKKENEDYDFMEHVIEKMDNNKENNDEQENDNRYSYSINSTNNIINENNNAPKIKGISINLNGNDNFIIINFPFFDYEAEKSKSFDKNNEMSLLMQYIIFLAFYLEDIKNDEIS